MFVMAENTADGVKIMAEKRITQLDSKIIDLLLAEIRSGRFRNSSILPPEVDLAEFFGVSRTTIRDALATLEQEGYISRKRKIGTLINRHVVDIRNRIDTRREFMEMVKDAGYDTKVDTIDVAFGEANELEACKLNITVGDSVLRVTKLVYADDTPTIFCIDSIPRALIRNDSFTKEDLEKHIFHFIKDYCMDQIHIALSELHAINADAALAKYLNVAEGDALLNIQELEYDFLGIPVLFSNEYYREGIISHTVVRQKID